MDSKYLISLIFFILIVILVGFQIFITGNNPLDKELKEQVQAQFSCEESCNNDLVCISECKVGISNIASVTKDESACNELQDSTAKQECISRVRTESALEANSLESCETLNNQELQQCKDYFYLRKAIESKDKSQCNNIQNERTKQACLTAK